jgi:hypothetical protein
MAAPREDEDDADPVLDMKSIDRDIQAGAKAFSKLLSHAADDWKSWSDTIRGLRALRSLVFSQTKTSSINSWHYRDALGKLLHQPKYSAYNHVDAQTRSAAYKLMDSLDEVDVWYKALPVSDKMKWKHPVSVVKHCPNHLVAGGKGGNKPKKAGKKKRPPTFEEERLRALVIEVIDELMGHDSVAARGYLKRVNPTEPEPDPDDEIEDIFTDGETSHDDD